MLWIGGIGPIWVARNQPVTGKPLQRLNYAYAPVHQIHVSPLEARQLGAPHHSEEGQVIKVTTMAGGRGVHKPVDRLDVPHLHLCAQLVLAWRHPAQAMLAQTTNDIPRAVSVDRAAILLGIVRSLVWELVRDGKLRSVRAGHRRVVPLSAIDEFLTGDTTEAHVQA